jgi:hypothetical protein
MRWEDGPYPQRAQHNRKGYRGQSAVADRSGGGEGEKTSPSPADNDPLAMIAYCPEKG